MNSKQIVLISSGAPHNIIDIFQSHRIGPHGLIILCTSNSMYNFTNRFVLALTNPVSVDVIKASILLCTYTYDQQH